MKILHITAHMGGGVGKVLSGVATHDKENVHSILCLEKTQSDQFEDICRQANIPVFLYDREDFRELCQHCDILQIEWWHHPLMAQFLVKVLCHISCRLVVWSHISGCNYPRLPFAFVHAVENFVFASPYSFENPSWTASQQEWARGHRSIVVSAGNDFRSVSLQNDAHRGLHVGYIGFLGYEKLHSGFAAACKAILEIPRVTLQIGGDMQQAEQLLQDMTKLDIADQVEFLGYLTDVNAVLRTLDIFFYPLAPTNTGTAENALLEAMAMGVVPIVLNQCSEKYIVTHLETGIVMDDIRESGDWVRWLITHPEEREAMRKNASQYVKEQYSIEKTVEELQRVYGAALSDAKKEYLFSEVFGATPFDWFRSCYAGELTNIQGMAWGDTKGSVKQYCGYFPEDEGLKKLVADHT